MSLYQTPKCTDVSDVSSPPSGRLYVPLQKNNAKSAGVIIDAAGGDGDETRNVSWNVSWNVSFHLVSLEGATAECLTWRPPTSGGALACAAASVARSTAAAASARWRRCCASWSHSTMAASSAVSPPPYPGTVGACCACARARGASSGDASARLASAKSAKSASATKHAEVPRTPPGVRGLREATAHVATMLGAVCARSQARSTRAGVSVALDQPRGVKKLKKVGGLAESNRRPLPP